MKTPDIIDTMAGALGMDANDTFGGGFGVAPNWTHGPSSTVAESAHLWLWVTDTYMMNGDGPKVAHALGFRPVASWPWVKTETAGADLQIGLGQYSRKAHEWLLLCTRGNACVPPTSRRPPSVIFAPRSSRHSEKPGTAYSDFIELVSDRTPRLEMFARRPRRGWSVWGNEV